MVAAVGLWCQAPHLDHVVLDHLPHAHPIPAGGQELAPHVHALQAPSMCCDCVLNFGTCSASR